MNGYRPREVATELSISTAVLRQWSVDFADLLSVGASAMGAQFGDANEWRYTSRDIALLGTVQALLHQGLTAQQVRAQLISRQDPQDDGGPSRALTITQEVGRALVGSYTRSGRRCWPSRARWICSKLRPSG